MKASLGVPAVAGQQNRDKIGEFPRGLQDRQRDGASALQPSNGQGGASPAALRPSAVSPRGHPQRGLLPEDLPAKRPGSVCGVLGQARPLMRRSTMANSSKRWAPRP